MWKKRELSRKIHIPCLKPNVRYARSSYTNGMCKCSHADLLLRPLRAEREHVDVPQCLHIPMSDSTLKKSDFFRLFGVLFWELRFNIVVPKLGPLKVMVSGSVIYYTLITSTGEAFQVQAIYKYFQGCKQRFYQEGGFETVA